MSSPTRMEVARALAVHEPTAATMADDLARQLYDLVEHLLTETRLTLGAELARADTLRTLQRYQVWRRAQQQAKR